tara:strand:+ start:708 stop:971 length:264 start_codon:yes stop_codon:yes gene_type:complete
MSQVEDSWMRPRTKAGTEEMRKRLKAMKFMLKEAATQSVEGRIASKVFDEYFSFDWDDEEKEEIQTCHKKFENQETEKKKVALPDRC